MIPDQVCKYPFVKCPIHLRASVCGPAVQSAYKPAFTTDGAGAAASGANLSKSLSAGSLSKKLLQERASSFPITEAEGDPP